MAEHEALKGRRVLVIGGARDLGLGVARAVARAGASVVIGARNHDAARAAAATIEGAEAVLLDIADEGTIREAATTLERVDHIISVANAPHNVPLADLDHDLTVRALEAKVVGPLMVAKNFVPLMPPDGSLVLFSGVVAWNPSPGKTVTGLTNGAVSFLATHLAREIAPIRVNAISPGIIDSGTWDSLGTEAKDGLMAATAHSAPAGRAGGDNHRHHGHGAVAAHSRLRNRGDAPHRGWSTVRMSTSAPAMPRTAGPGTSTLIPDTRLPLNTLAIPFGLAGLSGSWSLAQSTLGVSGIVSELLWLLTAAATVGVTVLHLVRGHRAEESLASQLRNPVQGPLAALLPTTGMLLGAHVFQTLPTLGIVMVFVSLAVLTVFAAWIVSFWLNGKLTPKALHPGYLLPTVAGGFVAAGATWSIGSHWLSIGAFILGAGFWIVMLPPLLARFALAPALPAGLIPTMAILAAPPVVGGNAWFVLHGNDIDGIQAGLGSAAVLFALVQLFLLPRYLKLHLSIASWSFSFTAAAATSYILHWLSLTTNPAAPVAGWTALLALSAFIALITIGNLRNTVRSMIRPRPFC